MQTFPDELFQSYLQIIGSMRTCNSIGDSVIVKKDILTRILSIFVTNYNKNKII